MTDINILTKNELAVIIGGMTPSQIKKASHNQLMNRAAHAQGKLTEMNAFGDDPDVLDNSSFLTPTEDDVLAILKNLTVPQQHLLVAFAHCENTVVNGAPQQATGPADLTTWVWLEDRKVGDMTTAQKKGVLSSLVKKHLVHVTPDSDGDMLGWSLLGFDVVQSLLADELPAMPSGKKQNVAPTTRKGTEDRILVHPTDDATKISPIRAGTKRHMMAIALARGTTLEHLSEITGWRRDVVSSALYTDFKAAGLGIERKAGKLHLILPEGVSELPVRNAAA